MANEKKTLTPEEKQAQDAARIARKQALSMHIRALRRVLIVSASAVLIAFMVLFYLFCTPLDFVLEPVRSRGIEVISTAVSEALMLKFKSCLVAAVVIGMPVIVQQIWSFVSPALYANEKKLFAGLFFVMLLLAWCSATSMCSRWRWICSGRPATAWPRPCGR